MHAVLSPVVATEVVMPGLIEPSGLLVRQRPLAAPAAGQALVRMEASGVSFAEQSMRRGRYYAQPKFPFVPGYDLVGTVERVGAGVDAQLVGQRVAAMTQTGGWASHALLSAHDLVPVPAGVDAGEAETLVVNGVTAWQMLHRTARVQPGATVLVHGANGGVGTTLVQLARLHGVRVIGTSSPRHHAALRGLGVEPLDYNDPDLAGSVRRLAPDGVAAAFDHIGGESATRSFSLLAPGGTLVCYAVASTLKESSSTVWPFAAQLARVLLWNVLPNGRSASFYNVWAGSRLNRAGFQARFAEDLTAVLALLADGKLSPQIAARIPLARTADAMTLAESRTAYGKVVIVP